MVQYYNLLAPIIEENHHAHAMSPYDFLAQEVQLIWVD